MWSRSPNSNERLARDPNSTAPDARSLYRAAMATKATGIDPAAQKLEQRKATTAEPEADLVKVLWQKFLDKPTKKGKAKRPASRKRFERIFAPSLSKWGEKQINTIKRGDCEDAIAAAKLRGDHAAVSVHMVLSAFFTWCERRGDILKSPLKGLDRPAAESNSERDLTDDELKTIWAGCVAMGNPHGALNRMLLLTGQRRTEVAAMKFSEIDFEAREWNLGGKRTKNDNPHVVHLSDAALDIIKAAPRFENCDFVFTSDGKGYCTGFSKAKDKLDKLAPVAEPWTLHDFRRVVMTRMAKASISEIVAHKILNHGQKRGGNSTLDRIYNKHDYRTERAAALNWWALTLDRIVTGDASNVVPLTRA